jgi:hypothetical protein
MGIVECPLLFHSLSYLSETNNAVDNLTNGDAM